MHPKTLKALELEKVLQFFQQGTSSEGGKSFFSNLKPYSSLQDINESQNLLREFWELFVHQPLNLNFFPDLSPLFSSLEKEIFIFSLEDLWGLQSFFVEQDKVFSWLEKGKSLSLSLLTQYWESIEEPLKLKQAIFRCLSKEGELRDESSPGLYAVRQEIRSIHARCRKKVERFLQDEKISHYLQDEYLTLAADRYVLALKTNFKGKLQGIVHDYSQSGETCYFEPYFLVELNNHLQQLKITEKEEQRKVLEYLSQLARQEKEALHACYNFLVLVDVFLAKIKVGIKLQANPLNLTSEEKLELKEARHPLLVLLKQKVVPVDIVLEPGQKGLIITGGNAGGKTVCLKTLGLIALMVSCGLPVPCAKESKLPYFAHIWTIIGDEQSLEESLSTFTAQVSFLKECLPVLDSSSLLILDEFGAGTDPAQGAALAQAVMEYALEKGSWLLCATHFPGVKLYAVSSPELRVASVLFDPQTKKPLYQLTYDQVGASYALEVAKNIGLLPEVLNKASKLLGGEGKQQEALLERLNKLVWMKEQELEKFKQKREKIVSKLKKALKRLKEEKHSLEKEIQEAKTTILTQWKKEKLSRKLALEKLSKLRDKVKEPNKIQKSREAFVPKKDTQCLYLPWNKEAKILEIDEKKQQCKVDLGGISLWSDFSNLAPLTKKEQKDQSIKVKVSASSRLPLKLDVRGLTVEEALMEVDRYIDGALLKGVQELEIVHGKGTGVLKQAVHQHLRNHSVVKEFSFAPLEAGGEGATIVKLKN
ncbi:MAG: mismatch repair protein MutS2 [Desulfonauticus sp.]|jgi:DNA mismatch repair protein MutS2|nr:mismatch repair protein MutS2 [Desulfonauticus sp.]